MRGTVVLNLSIPQFEALRLILVEPISAENLAAQNGKGGGKTLVAVDELHAAEGEIVGIVEGREAANPFYPRQAPVDAYCALITEKIDYRPPSNAEEARGFKPK